MKKCSFLIFFILFFCISFCSYGQINSTLQKEHLHGQVKSMTNSVYFLGRKGEEGDDRWLKEKIVYSYNIAGLMTERVRFFENDTIRGYVTQYGYNADGKLISESGYNEDDGSNNAKWVIRYSHKSNRVEIVAYDDEGKRGDSEVHKYDNEGNEIEASTYFKDNQWAYTFRFKYDKAGNLIEKDQANIEHFDGADHPIKILYKYDEKGDIVEDQNQFKNKDINYLETFIYQVYDTKGNWTKKVCKMANKAISITERLILYY